MIHTQGKCISTSALSETEWAPSEKKSESL